MIVEQDPYELTQYLRDLDAADRNAVLVVIGTVVTVLVGRVLLALLRGLLIAAAVGAAVWVGYQVWNSTGPADQVVAPSVQLPTIGPLAPK